MEQVFLDTLANGSTKKSKVLIINQLENLKKRAKSKFLNRKYVLKLIDLKSPLEKAYWNTYYCNHVLEQEGQKIIGKYCNNRWCFVCNRIRTAKLINGYKPVVKSWNNPSYMVLTVKNVSGEQLRDKVKEMNYVFRKIVKNILKKDTLDIQAVRTIECTYNVHTNEYHPHFNVLINGYLNARMFIEEWLSYYPDKEAKHIGQFITRADNKTLNELFKYIVKPDDKTPAAALDIIYQSLHGIKIVCPTGVKKEVSEDIDELVSIEIPGLPLENCQWWWIHDKKGWYKKNHYPDEDCTISLFRLIKKTITLNFDSS
jgi:hypothetical protein